MERKESLSRNIHSGISKYSDIQLHDKMLNPYWIPKNNSDLFRVKQIFKTEKDNKKNSSTSKINKLSHLLKNNSTFQKDNYLKNNTITNGVLITDTDNDEESTYLKTKLDTENSKYNPTFQIEEINEDKEKMDNREEQIFNKYSNKLENKFISINQKKVEGVRDFITKTRELILMKYSMKMKEERIIREDETYKNDLESYKDSIIDMDRAKLKFESEFLVKFDLYLKHLSKKREKKKNELSKKKDELANLDAEYKQIDNKKLKNMEKKILFLEEYRLFQIFVKEDIMIGSHFDMKAFRAGCKFTNNESSTLSAGSNITYEQAKSGSSYLPQETVKLGSNSDQTKSLFMTKLPNNKKLNGNTKQIGSKPITSFSGLYSYAKKLTQNQEERNNIKKDDKIISHIDEKIAKYNFRKIIFQNPVDLIDKLKMNETINLKKLQEYNDLTSQLIVAQKDLLNLQKEDHLDNSLRNDILDKEGMLSELKLKKAKLLEEKSKLSMLTSTQNLSWTKKKIHKTRANSKLYEIYDRLPSQFKESETKKLLLNNMISNTEKDLEMLRIIERTFDLTLMKYHEFSETMNSFLREYEKELEIERKKKITMDQNKEIEEKNHNLRLAVYERQNKIYALPKRKINIKMKPMRKEFISEKIFKQEENLNLCELLSYDNDFRNLNSDS